MKLNWYCALMDGAGEFADLPDGRIAWVRLAREWIVFVVGSGKENFGDPNYTPDVHLEIQVTKPTLAIVKAGKKMLEDLLDIEKEPGPTPDVLFPSHPRGEPYDF